MPEPIRVLHFADLHVGMENYGRLDPMLGVSSRVRDFLDRLDEVIEYALGHEADLVVFAGDAFKTRDPNTTQQREFGRRIKRLADAVPTFMLVGNHDLPGSASKATSVDIFQALDVPNVVVGNTADSQVFRTRRGPIYLAWVPYPMRNRLLAQEDHRGKSFSELDAALRDAVAAIVQDLTREAAGHDMPRVLVGHFSVSGATFGSERSVMLGHDLAIQRATLSDPVWDYVALGHIHKHQDLNPGGRPPVVYSGSLERIDFGEEGEPKGFCWVQAARGETSYEFVRVHARPFITLTVDVRGQADPMAVIHSSLADQNVTDAVVRVQLRLHQAQRSALREGEIEALLSAAHSVTVAQDVEYDVRARLGHHAPETLSPEQLLEHFFHSRDVPDDRLRQLIERAAGLLHDG